MHELSLGARFADQMRARATLFAALRRAFGCEAALGETGEGATFGAEVLQAQPGDPTGTVTEFIARFDASAELLEG